MTRPRSAPVLAVLALPGTTPPGCSGDDTPAAEPTSPGSASPASSVL